MRQRVIIKNPDRPAPQRPTCQLESLISGHIDGEVVKRPRPGTPGTTIWRTAKRGQELIDQRLARLPLPVAAEPATIEPATAPAETPEKTILVRSDGWPLDRFSRVERAWEGKTVVCIAGGPSLTAEQLEVVRTARAADRCRVIVVNTTFLRVPWADLLYFADSKWWVWFTRGSETSDQDKAAFRSFTGLKCTIWVSGNAVTDRDVHMLRIFDGSAALSRDPAALATCSNSGHQVVNLAALAGAGRIPLLGYDAKAGPGGRKHHHADHPDKSEAPYAAMQSNFPRLAQELGKIGVEVVNCSPGSALKCFPMGRIEEVLAA